jgi:hypothetical protein
LGCRTIHFLLLNQKLKDIEKPNIFHQMPLYIESFCHKKNFIEVIYVVVIRSFLQPFIQNHPVKISENNINYVVAFRHFNSIGYVIIKDFVIETFCLIFKFSLQALLHPIKGVGEGTNCGAVIGTTLILYCTVTL